MASETLLELLKEAANIAEAHAHDEHIEAAEWGDANDRSPRFRETAARLRAAATRLREELECDRPQCLSCEVLRRINGGPLK